MCFFALGPAIVTPDELGDPHNLGIRCSVNGVLQQNSNTNQLVFKTEEVVAWCSKFATLLPGDVILTGTPPGVGVFRKPPLFLKVTKIIDTVFLSISYVILSFLSSPEMRSFVTLTKSDPSQIKFNKIVGKKIIVFTQPLFLVR